ncbi:MAG: hypothetical protein RJA49_2420 [Actinomycetota bacterium]|jgi:HK97 family phage major capsid protein
MLIEQLRAQLRAILDQRQAHNDAIDALVSTAEARGSDFTVAETEAFNEARAARSTLKGQADALDARIAELVAEAEERAALETLAATIPTTAERVVGGSVVRSEARTYRPDVRHSFLADLFDHQVSRLHADSTDRIQRHQNEVAVELRGSAMTTEHRDIVVSGMAGIVPPQWLVDQFAPIARAGRPFLNSLNALTLPPDGVTFNIPRGTTGTTAAMTAEAAAWNETDYVAADLPSTVNLVTAQQDLSRTLFMRGGGIVDQVLFPDLIADAEVKLNAAAINGNGTAPQHRGILQVAGISAVAYTDATPTVGEAWPKLSDAIQRINSLRFMPATAVYMHPRRWGWVTAAVDTVGRPLFEFTKIAPNSVFGLGVAAEYGQVVGTLQGLPVITDASIPTTLGGGTEDIIFVARTFDILYWEDNLLQFTFEQVLGPEKVRLAVGRFSMFQAGRYPASISTIGGTGLIAPTF